MNKLSGLKDTQKSLVLEKELLARKRKRKFYQLFPETGALSRHNYQKHLHFFQVGGSFRERCFMAGNRSGKTVAGAYEMTCHLTGLYPDWWEGKRFDRPTSCWAAGKRAVTVRDIIQKELLGPIDRIGTGLIPGDLIDGKPVKKAGFPDAIEIIRVKHVSGGSSELTLKSYEQGRDAFEGTAKDFIWEDEEPPLDIHGECLLRTMTTDGILALTFTPLEGLSEVVLSFMPGGKIKEGSGPPGKCIITATWDDAPHLTEGQKTELWESMPPHQREARSKGIPQLGSGKVYPVPETDFEIEDFQIPEFWPRCYAMDVGWNRTACLWGAWDRDSDTVYIYSEYYKGEAEPAVHADAIKARGEWLPGVIDPAARGRSQLDGKQLLIEYQDLGLDVSPAKNTVEAGIHALHRRLSSGRLKVFRSMRHFFDEYRIYRRDDKGKVVKDGDHIMDCARYLIMSGLDLSMTKPEPVQHKKFNHYAAPSGAWMGA